MVRVGFGAAEMGKRAPARWGREGRRRPDGCRGGDGRMDAGAASDPWETGRAALRFGGGWGGTEGREGDAGGRRRMERRWRRPPER